ncbi:grasp-with-spasm system SPASM domain peptide maturase [Cellulophaga baltica]|uniref:grasp-with-spasm system SPASM domain peptide maturase n=1 Tax=Cellulophaga baltica TaxID=76594 RepID=UPI002147348A|nr:grasp-with-spasm system SPASM domain peptide maturase [Cellulophaga baltica]MCR1025761.1 grasp-with-spasm system SPASM domain peptide maturase [Cellulophaga baltica]
MNKKVVLYSNCLLVKGANRSVICDVQLQTIHYIPNSLYELLKEHSGKSVDDIKQSYDNKFNDVIDAYFKFLEDKEIIFYTNTPERFPSMNLDWHYPHKVSNVILDYNNSSNYDIKHVLKELEELRCKNVQLRFFSAINKEFVISILQYIKDLKSIITSIELIVKNSEWTSSEEIKELFLKYPRLSAFNIHSAEENEIISYGNKFIVYTQQVINSEAHCGIISMNYFAINLKTFTESKQHNSCLNRKISIDTNGNIKNCPSMNKIYGSIKNTKLKNVIDDSSFQEVWNINKDQIDVCKDCEFRYICTDCRAYLEKPEDTYSKPLKCGYNPYTNEWEEWSTNKLKNKAKEFYGLTDLSKEQD